jgi:hypothetical protein
MTHATDEIYKQVKGVINDPFEEFYKANNMFSKLEIFDNAFCINIDTQAFNTLITSTDTERGAPSLKPKL